MKKITSILFYLGFFVWLAGIGVGCSSGSETADAGDIDDGQDGATQTDDGMPAGDDGQAGDDGGSVGDDGGQAGDDGGSAGDDGGQVSDDGGSAGDDGGQVGDDGPPPDWSWCPQAYEYVGGDWPWTLKILDESVYCASFNEARTLKEEYDMKARMKFVPGDYPLPAENGTYPFLLPVCFEMREAGTQPLINGEGTILANHTDYDGGIQYRFTIDQPMQTAGGVDWIYHLELNAWKPIEQTEIAILDGAYQDPYGIFITNMLCIDECWTPDSYQFESCHFDSARHQYHTVDFEGGQLVLHVMMGDSMASTEPAAFVRGNGALHGTAFDQLDYYKLIYNPEHHHFARDFAVLFDQPIGGACGLLATGMDMYEPNGKGELATINCDLSEIDKLTITNIAFENGW
ncbi:MAG: hypothetical protein JRJ19_12235 [Deltaproteobacteria bacterium]|nr:hypothetical protein [Deltaproteobacteria bacterium]MBW1872829.1 hypothetical protein [Deltaproteobacteria bacterium]